MLVGYTWDKLLILSNPRVRKEIGRFVSFASQTLNSIFAVRGCGEAVQLAEGNEELCFGAKMQVWEFKCSCHLKCLCAVFCLCVHLGFLKELNAHIK